LIIAAVGPVDLLLNLTGHQDRCMVAFCSARCTDFKPATGKTFGMLGARCRRALFNCLLEPLAALLCDQNAWHTPINPGHIQTSQPKLITQGMQMAL
jgi:hypothetical protein